MGTKCPACHFDNPDTQRFCGECGTQLPPPQDHPPARTETLQAPVRELGTGTTFAGRFQVIEELGHGGMGRVYKVFDTKIKEKVALKLIKPEIATDRDTIERFNNEIRLARRIRHKNVCGMYDLGEAEGSHFITMEYVHGEDLKSLIEMSGSLSLGMLLSVGKQVSDGLAEAHGLGVVHRDLKPQNIMVDRHGNAKIMDFGIARSVREKGLTGPSVMIGTPEYMSPEQAEAKEVDQRSDIYSLGVILYEMATSHVPFTGETALSIAMKHKGELPKNPKQLNPQIPDDLGAVILKCLEKDKAKRYQSAAEVRSELEKIEKGVPTTERVVPERKTITSREITVKFTLRKLAFPALGVLALAAVAVVTFRIIPKGLPTAPPASGKPAIAILYFDNISGDQNLDAWKTGLAELLITKLSQSRFINVLDGNAIYTILKKLGLEEARKYTKDDLLRIANEGKATYTLSGSLLKAGPKLVMALSLQKPHTGEVVSTPNIECRGEDEIFAKVDELARLIRADLKLTPDQMASDIDKDAEKITTRSPEAFKYYVEARKKNQDSKDADAVELYQKAISIDPEFAMAYRGMAAAYGNLGYVAKDREAMGKAMEFIERVSEREKLAIQGKFYYSNLGTYDKALDSFERLLRLYPEDALAASYLGFIYRSLEEYDKARTYFEITAKLTNSNQSWSNLGFQYELMGLYQQARDVYEEYLKNNPDSPDFHRALASNYLKEGRLAAAVAEADRAFLLDPKGNDNLSLKGEILYQQDDLRGAEIEFRKMLDVKPDSYAISARGYLANIHLRRGQFGQAAEQQKQIIEHARRIGESVWEAVAHLSLFDLYWRQRKLAEAAAEAARYAAIPADEDTYSPKFTDLFNRSVLSIENNDTAEASRTAGELKALVDATLFRRLMRYYFLLRGLIALEEDNMTKAVGDFEKAVESDPAPQNAKDPFFLDFLARAYVRNGDLDKGRATYEKIISQVNGKWSGDIYVRCFYELGRIAERQGDKAKARELYGEFLELWKDAEPGLPEVDEARKRLAGLAPA